jgi:hypothetical protein
MKLIDEFLFDKITSEVSYESVNESLLTDHSFSNDLRKYLSIEQYPSKFKDVDPSQLYYNKYYYYLKFLVAYQKQVGVDAGLEQQEFKILEEGQNYSDVDWEVLERISKEIKGN